MFNNILPVSSLFCKILLLRLPHCLPACIHFPFCSFDFMLCASCPFVSQLFFCSFQLLHSDPSLCMNHLQQHPQQSQQQQQPHLFSIPCIYSLCAPCACNIRHFYACSHRANFLHISSALPNHHRDSSTSLAVQPLCLSSLGVMPRFLFLSGS